MKIQILVLCIATLAGAEEWFAPFQRVADYKPKGPTHCFRQFNHDWSWIALRPDQIPEFLSEADPVALAELFQRTHVDGTVVMAVPHHGYCTYETRVGTKFPGMKGDWFGRTIEELHKRKIAAFGYVTLNWNWKFIRENLGRDFIHGQPDADGVCRSRCTICLNAPGYLELVEAYTREVLENYPVDGMRWDILKTAECCLCSGCKKFYRETYGEELTPDSRRFQDFYLATTGRAVTRLRVLCKRIKPSVEIWQNSIQSYHPNHLDLSREMDIAYNEYGDPFRLQFIRGVANKPAAINGLMNKTPTEPPVPLDRREWRTCLALGGRCYSYYGHKHASHRTLLPNDTMLTWHREQLAPFYKMVSEIEPWLQDAQTVSHIGVVFSERTRFQFPKYDRTPYINMMEPIANACLQRSAPVEFVNALDLDKPLSRFKLLIAPLTSGLNEIELEHLRRCVRDGGNLLVGGDAIPFPSSGKGKVVHLRNLNSPEIIDRLAGHAPVVVQPTENRVILTRQEKQRRWVLHLLDDGPCTVEIRREFAAPTKIAHQYPASGWTCAAEKTPTGLRIKASGPAADRLAVLE
ncbi:MAG: hypothetical protein FJ395_15805 [Verrucomicrobia bacterium]|nr:hypothetical protein [Verrucomicrobiota bacterium]